VRARATFLDTIRESAAATLLIEVRENSETGTRSQLASAAHSRIVISQALDRKSGRVAKKIFSGF
jgi:hypothetical protein